jgi:hypothetical protein
MMRNIARELLRISADILVGDFEITLPSSVRGKINGDMNKFLSSNYLPDIPLKKMFGILARNKVTPIDDDGTYWSGFLTGKEGRASIELAYKGGTVKNALLQIQWYKMPSGNYEVNAYVS